MGSIDEEERGWARYLLALIPSYQGKRDRALEVLNQGITADELEGFQGRGYWQKLFTKATIYAEKKDVEQAITAYEKLVQSYEKAYPENPAGWRGYDVYLLVKAGELSRATDAHALNKDTNS